MERPSADEAAATVSYRIVCTNYEHAFAPDVAGKISGAHPMLFAKSVLFCMEQMFDPIHPEVQEYITVEECPVYCVEGNIYRVE